MSKSGKLPIPIKDAIIFENKNICACLANHPITRGHCIVFWKNDVSDLHELTKKEYEELMRVVDDLRNALLKAMSTNKVYLFYMDEIKHVHWHLIPRTENERGFTLIEHEPKTLKDTSLAKKIKKTLILS